MFTLQLPKCRAVACLSTLLAVSAPGCSKKQERDAKPAPTITPPAPLPQKAQSDLIHHFDVDPQAAQVEFAMEAPLEKIRGRVPSKAVQGGVWVDRQKQLQLAGTFRVSLSELELFQRKADKGGAFGQEVKNDTQNEHARNWLEIDNKAPANEREKNLQASFSFEHPTQTSTPKLSELPTGEHRTEWTASGPFIIHQRSQNLSVSLIITVDKRADGELHIKQLATSKPVPIDLDKFDVRPRTAFGKLAQKSLSMMSEKVAQVADLKVVLPLKTRRPSPAASKAEPATNSPPSDAAH